MRLESRRVRTATTATVAGVIVVACLILAACAPKSRPPADRGDREQLAVPAVVIDGRFDDWGDAPTTSFPGDGTIRGVATREDRTSVYLALSLAGKSNVQGRASPLLLVFDADGDEATGPTAFGVPGADLVVSFTALTPSGVEEGIVAWRPDPDEPNRGLAPSNTMVPSDLGLWFEPRHSTDRIEVRLRRDRDRGRFADEGFAGRAIVLDERGREREASPIFRHRSSDALAGLSGSTGGTSSSADLGRGVRSLDRTSGADLRVVVWNVAGRLASNPEPARAILAALDPDLVLLDEVSARVDVETVRSLLPQGAAAWAVHIGTSGGRQRGVIAARAPVTPAPEFALVPYADSTGGAFPGGLLPLPLVAGGVPATGAWVEMSGRRVLAVAIDLTCCGNSVDSRQDIVRRLEAVAINRAARAALDSSEGRTDAVILGGDFNLVGSEAPLSNAARGLGEDGSDLAPVYALQLDGASTATWVGPGTRFPPGQLDYLLHPASLVPLRAFVLETEDLHAADLAALGLSRASSDAASDHRPVVADFRWR